MSTGNGGACAGLANTNKQGPIGTYVQDVGVLGQAGPEAVCDYTGVNGKTSYDTNVLGETIGFTVPSNSGAAAGKTA